MRQPKTTEPGTDLIVAPKGTALISPEDYAAKAKAYAEQDRAPATKRAYKMWTTKYQGWCEDHGVDPLPPNPAVLIAWQTWLAEGQPGRQATHALDRYGGGRKLAATSMQQMWSALGGYFANAGFPLGQMQLRAAHGDDQRERDAWGALKRLREGVHRGIAQSREVRKVEPVLDVKLRDMLDLLRPNVLREARDAAILAVGFGACRRRSEVVGLDFQTRGKGKGVLTLDPKMGIKITLHVSKTNQAGREETYYIYRRHLPLLCDWIENWIKVSKPKPGEPLFKRLLATGHSKKPQSGYRGVYWFEDSSGKGSWRAFTEHGGQGFIGYFDDPREAHLARCAKRGEDPHEPFAPHLFLGKRLLAQRVAEIVKLRYANVLRARYGKRLRPDQEAAIEAEAKKVSGHSLRAGFITSAAELGHAVHQIQQASGHATAAMVAGYTRVKANEKSSAQGGMKLGGQVGG